MRQLKFIMFFVLGIWLVPLSVLAQFTETKEIRKEFKVSPETRIEISNKYGKIELNSWEKDSVVIEIKIRVEEKKLSKLEDAIDAINFDFTQSGHFLIVQTLVGQNKSGIGKEISKFKETVFHAKDVSVATSQESEKLNNVVKNLSENSIESEKQISNINVLVEEIGIKLYQMPSFNVNKPKPTGELTNIYTLVDLCISTNSISSDINFIKDFDPTIPEILINSNEFIKLLNKIYKCFSENKEIETKIYFRIGEHIKFEKKKYSLFSIEVKGKNLTKINEFKVYSESSNFIIEIKDTTVTINIPMILS